MKHRIRVNRLEDRTVPALVINELYVNPPGTDDNREFIELWSTTGGVETGANLALVEIEGNPGLSGVIGSDLHLSGAITGTNGFALFGLNYDILGTPWGALVPSQTALGDLTSQMTNDHFTMMLVEGYTGTVGQDLDTNDDGVLDVTPWTSVVDSVSWQDPSIVGGKVYSPAQLTQSSLTPDAAARFSTNATPQSTGAWYDGEILALGGTPDMSRGLNPAKASTNLPANAAITPGFANFAAPAQVSAIVVNEALAQRSLVTTLRVDFDQVVTLPGGVSAAFQLTRQSDGAAIDVMGALDDASGKSIMNLTFTGSLVVAGSLPDGKYTLTIAGSQVANFDGNGDGIAGDNYVLVGNTTTAPKLFRMFGDADGDGDVDLTDFAAFRAAFGNGVSIFDSDGDGDTDLTDFAAFRSRFGSTLP